MKYSFFDVITAPVITEKATLLSANNQVVFLVAPTATKVAIKHAVESIFGVKVKAVRTANRKGKTKRFRGFSGKQKDTKRAFVTLMPGESLENITM